MREISRIDNLKMYLWSDDILKSQNKASLKEAEPGSSQSARAISRRTKFLKNNSQVIENEDHFEEIKQDPSHKKIFLRYFLSPTNVSDQNNVEFERTVLQGDAYFQKCIPSVPEEKINLKSDLWLKSVGYRSIPIENIPFNPITHTVPHDKGWVVNENGDMIKGLYVWGWAKRGPSGIIDATLRDSFETFRSIKFHLENKLLDPKENSSEKILKKIKK